MKERLAKVNHVLFFLVLLTVVLYYGKPLLIPLFFAIMMAMLMAPVCRWLDGKGIHRILSALICVLILLVIFLSMLGIMVGQISSFVGDLSEVEQQSNQLLVSIHQYIEKRFKIPTDQQIAFLQRETSNIGAFLRTYLTNMLASSVQLVIGLVFTLVFTYLFLFHKEKYYAFFLKFTKGDTPQQKEELLDRIGLVSQHYLFGRAISIIVLFILYALALVIIGIKNALLLAAMAALVNIIPYLGPIIAAVFPFAVALVTEESAQPAIWVLISFMLFQAIDNYFVTPYFLGGEVSLSALATIISMIIGGFLWGVSGMILFIPIFSIVKIIFDQIPGLEHFGYLIGDQGSKPSKHLGAWFRKLFSKR
ncbi:MAG TPA: AI-2E family transporter [Flavisolibacter sp.]|nr:AI-2E family transporter [Flavisolibacter sp.]